MEIASYIINKFKETKGEHDRILVGICGRAGGGKTTITEKLSKELDARKISNITYSGDWRFILDSKDRKLWLQEKWRAGIDAYIYALNQISWWEFTKIYQDLDDLMKGRAVTIDNAYNRITGKKDITIDIPAINQGIIFYENSILGGIEILENIDVILLLNTLDEVCFKRIMKKDSHRRSISDIAARYLITTYSENIFFEVLLDKFSSKTVICDSDGKFARYPEIHNISNIPVPIYHRKYKECKKGTVFCDLDGTLIKHVPVPSETGEEIEIIDGSVEKLREFREKDYYLILTTSRPYDKVFGVIEKLMSEGLNFDQIICDLPVGPRHLINDSKDDEIRAIAHVLKRDEGIKSINLP